MSSSIYALGFILASDQTHEKNVRENPSGDDDPDLSEKELEEIGMLLLRHAMANSQQSLAAAILSRFL